MELETGTGRLSPYELVFGVSGLAEREFPAIVEEAEKRRVAVSRRDQFAGLDRVGNLLQQIVPEDADPIALDRHLEIVFHCVNFWNQGCPLYAFEASVVRSLVDHPPQPRSGRFRVPYSSLYVELPKNLFWSAVAESEPPEPLEGIFVLSLEQPAPRLELLLVLGMRPDRPGFSVAGVSASLNQAVEARDVGSFGSEIPGADLAGLYSLREPSQAILLLSRLLWYVDAYPESVDTIAGSSASRDTRRVAPTTLEHYRVALVERSRG